MASTSVSPAAAAAVVDLSVGLPPGRVLSGHLFEESRRVWNGAVSHVPAVIVRPESVGETQTTICIARHHHLRLSVRAGGHDWAGRCLRPGGLVVDLTRMRRVDIDPSIGVATVQGGATAGDVISAARDHGLVAVTGTTGGVGMAGLTLGGGYGPLSGCYGLGLDNLLRAEVVFGDGRRAIADDEHDPELYWALRGGGGNFGVVTSLDVRLHPITQVLAGLIIYPWAQAEQVWMKLDDILGRAADQLTVQTGILAGPNGEPTLFVSPVWSGELSRGERSIDELAELGTPLSCQVGAMTYAEMLGLFDAQVVTGRHYAMRTRTVAGYTPAVIAALIEAGDAQTSPLSAVAIHHFHGAATSISPEATAFGVRMPHYVVEILAAWQPGDDRARHRAWADRLWTALGPHALPGGYANLLGPGDHDQIAHAYGPNAVRLGSAKARYDPDDVFSAIPLPSHGGPV
jgi:hypothetical protein